MESPSRAPASDERRGNAALLAELVVLDFTRVLAGPHCTRMLADLGARVIKIERPGEGDEMRRAPLRLPGEGDQSTYFARRNAGKESVGLDLGKPEARSVVLDLAAKADVVVENFVPGVAERLGCGYASLSAVRPDIVYASISGYGQTGPDSRQGAFAHVIAAASGIMYLDADPELGPRSSHLQAADVLAGTNALSGILAALWRRTKTGQGARIDVSMLESLIAAEDIAFGAVPNGGQAVPGPRPGMGLSRVDGRWLAWQSGGAPALWPRLVSMLERPDLLRDPRFESPEMRRESWPELERIVSEWLGAREDVHRAAEALRAARIPCAIVQSPAEVVRHPQIIFREAFGDIDHPGGGRVRVSASPYWIDDRPVPARGAAPYRIGEHTEPVLRGLLGYGDERLEALVRAGAIAPPG